MNGPNRPDRWRIDMNEQEQLKQLKEEYENMTIPEAGRERLQAGIDRARMEKKRAERVRRRSAWTAAAAAVIVLIALPNTNMQIAHAMENIPVLGGFFRLVTVRQYNYSDDNHDAEVELAQISYGEDAGEGVPAGEVAVGAATLEGTAAESVEGVGVGQEAAEAKLSEDGVEAVNQDMEATVEELIRQFEDTLSEEGYHGLHVTQEVVTDNARYYTVKLSVLEPAASTVISTIPKTFTLSIRVSIRAQKPFPLFSGKTEVLVFVIPATRAITLDVAHGEPPIFLYALVSVIVAVGPMAYTFFVAPPIIPDSLIWRSIH